MTATPHACPINSTISILTHASIITIHRNPFRTFTSITSTRFTFKKLLIISSNTVHIFAFNFFTLHCVHVEIKSKKAITTGMFTGIVTFDIDSVWSAFEAASVWSFGPKFIWSTSFENYLF